MSAPRERYHFVGIGGSGMSAIAQILAGWDNEVSGSDRSNDRGEMPDFFQSLRSCGITLAPQDGSAVRPGIDAVVVSTSIEESNPDFAAAQSLRLPVRHRSELLADLFNHRNGIAVGGTSGKSTCVGMIGHMLVACGRDPTVLNGGKIKNFHRSGKIGNARPGKSDIVCIEADESDGSIINYHPKISLITNITKDHKDIDDLVSLFTQLLDQTERAAILNADCPFASQLDAGKAERLTFGIESEADVRAENISRSPDGSEFTVDGDTYSLPVPGKHNVYNALAAIATGRHMGLKPSAMVRALNRFQGIERRLEIIGKAWGVTVVDDYSHNPSKIKAAIASMRPLSKRLIVVYQPHGFAPTKFLREELVETFVEALTADDLLYMPEIFYAGGTAAMDISAADIVADVRKRGRNAFFIRERDKISVEVAHIAHNGDSVLVMGARDDTLTSFCRSILRLLQEIEKNEAPRRA